MTEAALQASIIKYLDTVLPPSIRAVHVMNNPRSPVHGARAKAQGMRAGVPDIMLIRSHGYVAFLEVKTAKGGLSEPQKEWADWLASNDIPYAVVRSISDVETALQDFNIPTRRAA